MRSLYATSTSVTGNVDALVAARGGQLALMGFTCRESASSPGAAAFNIVDGATGAGGAQVVPVELAANSSSERAWFGPDGIKMGDGISIDHVAGEFEVTVFYRVD